MIGGSQVVTVLASLAKMKVAAVVLGPAGVGLVGLFMNLISTAASIAALGTATTGVRQVVTSTADTRGELAVATTRRALFLGSTVLAITGAGLFWACRSWIARIFLSDESLADDVGWLSIGVALTVLASAQVALLTGLRRVGDLAQINIAAGIVGGLVSVLALYLWPAQGVVVLAVVAPAFSFIFGRLLIIRLGKPALHRWGCRADRRVIAGVGVEVFR